MTKDGFSRWAFFLKDPNILNYLIESSDQRWTKIDSWWSVQILSMTGGCTMYNKPIVQ
jgi:hypothetical protein